MKSLIILLFIFSISVGYAQKNIYEKDIIKIEKGKPGTNEQLEINVYVKDFNIDNAKKVCAYLKNYYADKAKKLNNKLTIEINVWSKKLAASDIINGPDFYEPAASQKQFYKSAKWKQYLKLEEKYYHGGTIYNYANGVYNEDIY